MENINPDNVCNSLKVEKKEILSMEDSFKRIFELQSDLQERLGRSAIARKSNMQQKCLMIQEEIFNFNAEIVEMLERLPFKHWKKYPPEAIADWMCDEQRKETLFEFVDAFHFFLNMAIILEFQPEEIIAAYESKNKENHKRQDNGY